MNKAPLVVSPQALEDLEETWLFIAQDNVEAADRFEQKIRKTFCSLTENPGIGHKREDLTDKPVLFSRKPVRAGRPSLTSLSGHIGRPGSFVIIRKWVFIG
jgi:plasmid stabilization system protein ParE